MLVVLMENVVHLICAYVTVIGCQVIALNEFANLVWLMLILLKEILMHLLVLCLDLQPH